ncbi:amino acid ABC transporter permease [Viridibacillus sp. FSL R5-0477]|uniref:Polar amino acid ABC transporter inner membrane subunit n=1 Tax=Viridibacillus arenosi FSL R5-213 TaxID=1227360 RepID=W4F1D1_9BACL|nr:MULTISPECIES: amino acid ABC transporter permease [Viridibacillus]ETT86269.1 polar amino acid ABC transporter inner membrane subunit [Viridibacillus arenosi FSL R5-213]OMC84830.1 cystine transporter permease [Viridibacillus sp. FSL H8-0123]OMC85826.1 cystine transporter permease [Viridibacillus sp. FSL H7-0596]OMC91878.1 cystine transporter permease [Viridibacillus arenosi]
MNFLTNITSIFQTHGIEFLKATVITVELTFVSLIIATIIGLVFAFFKVSNIKILGKIADIYIFLIRGMPLIVQLMFLYYGISSVFVLSDFTAGALALGIHSGAYIAEIFRGSIQSIDRGQVEAARSLGMPYMLGMRRIILPQAFKRAIPALGNQFIIGLKDSSLVAYIAVSELFNHALSAQAANYMPFETYFVVGIYYLILVLIFTLLFNKLEKKLDVGGREKKNDKTEKFA